MIKTLAVLIVSLVSCAVYASDDKNKNCGDDLHPDGLPKRIVGKVVDRTLDGDPVYENLGHAVDYTLDGEPIYKKIGEPAYRIDRHGVVTGYTYDGDPLYDGEKDPKYSIDGDRRYPRDKPVDSYDP